MAETREQRIERLAKAKSDEGVSDFDRLIRLAHMVAAFRDVPDNAYIAAYATPDGGVNGVTYGDIGALVRINVNARERLDRIATWHARETGPGGMVGDYCTECGEHWPCDTRRMADGTHEDLKPDGDT